MIYHDQLDNVIDTVEVPVNGSVEVLPDSPIVKTTKDTECHVGWATEKDGTKNVAGTLNVGEEDINLYPIVKEGYWVSFDTDGGTAYNRQFIALDAEGDDKKAKKPELDPYKEGYIFDKWYADAELTIPYDFNAEVTENTTIYAGYDPDPDTLYTVVYWIQYQSDYKTDTWDYKWIARQTKSGTTGKDAVYDEDYIFNEPYKRSSKGYVLNEDKTEKATIAADGTTVLNVYYDCNTFHFSFTWKNDSGQNQKFIDQDMKYSASTRPIWDVIDEARGETTWRFVFVQPAGWAWIRCFSDWPTIPDENQDWVITDNPNDNLFYRIWLQTLDVGVAPDGYTAETNHSARVQLGYSTDSRTYYLYDQGSFNAGSNGAITPGTDGAPEGFAFRLVLSDGNGNDTTVWFHAHRDWTYYILDNTRASAAKPGPQYEFNSTASLSDVIGYVENDGYLDCYCIRLSYDFKFHENGGEEVPDRKVSYERNLTVVEPKNYVIGETQKTDPDGQVMIFDGWYTNVELTEKFETFDITMPAHSIDLYAKWVPITYSVTYQFENGDPDQVIDGIEYGGHAPQSAEPTYENHIFLGWTLDGRPYNFDSGVSKDITLVAKWRSMNAYQVTYDLNGGSGTAPVDPNKYYENGDVNVLGTDGVVAPKGKVFLGWKSSSDGEIYYANGLAKMPIEGLTMTAQWGDIEDTVELTYDFNFDSIGYTAEGEKSVTIKALPNNGNVIVSDYPALGGEVPEGYVFKGWNTKADGSGTDVDPGDKIYFDKNGENRLYAIWEKEPEPDEPETPEEETNETPSNPHLTVIKTTISTPANKTAYRQDEIITYSITVTNDGNVAIDDVVLSDALTNDKWTVGTLKPGESHKETTSYTVTAKDVTNGKVVNVATATGKSSDPRDTEVPVTNGSTEDKTTGSVAAAPAAAPKTGDNTPLMQWSMILLIALGVVMTLVRRRQVR